MVESRHVAWPAVSLTGGGYPGKNGTAHLCTIKKTTLKQALLVAKDFAGHISSTGEMEQKNACVSPYRRMSWHQL